MSQTFNRWLGMRRLDNGDLQLETRGEHEVMPGTIHFAVLTTLAEVAAAGTVEAAVVPTNVNMSLLRRAEPGVLIARGRLLKKGRRLAFAEGEVYQGDRLVAKAAVQFAVMG